MAKFVFRLVALITTAVVTSPAWASWDDISSWLPSDMPQFSAVAVLGIAVIGLIVGRFASRKRLDP
jgi:hypothetical protein